VAAQSEAWVFDRIHVGIAGSNPAGDVGVFLECCMLSFTGLCDGPITLPEESYGMWCVYECDPGTLERKARLTRTVEPRGGKKKF